MKKNTTIIATLLLTVVLGIAFAVTAQNYYALEKEACFRTLTNHTAQLADKINEDFTREHDHLEFIARVIGQFETSETGYVSKILTSYDSCAVISRIELLLPGDKILTDEGRQIDGSGLISFEEAAEKGAHMTGRTNDLLHPDKMILRDYVPVIRDGQTVAMLYGVVELDQLPDMYHVKAFNNRTQVYIIDCDNGNFLMDTLHSTLKNVEEMDSRKPQSGYSFQQMKNDIEHLQAGSTAFLSQSTGEYFYCYYEPLKIQGWMLMLSVPESIVFGRLHSSMSVALYLASFMAAVLVLYFVWMLFNIRRENRERDSRLHQVQYMYDVEKLLFNAHVKPADIEKALWKIAEVMTADMAFLLPLNGSSENWRYVFKRCDAKLTDAELADAVAHLQGRLEDGKSILTYDPESLADIPAGMTSFIRRLGLRSLAVVPISDANEGLVGILGTCNMKQRFENAEQLECVAISFAMLIRNIRIYQSMKKIGMMDGLTGLLNRSSYSADLASAAGGSYRSLACVYIDANGLHEINNHLGHEAGDRLLCFLANQMMDTFGSNSAYRIGGDEFVAICRNQPQKAVYQKAESVRQAMAQEGYYISLGVEWRDLDCNINAIVKAAEEKMQQDKRNYYEKDLHQRKVREMNQQLEQILVEKRDADAFLSVIAPNFRGVYFVNLDTDSVRHIFIPDYFEEMLEQSDQRFSQAIHLYANQVIHPRFSHAFEELCSYESLGNLLDEGIVPELCYQKTNGAWLKLQIFKFKKYRPGSRETLWVFEPIEPPEEG